MTNIDEDCKILKLVICKIIELTINEWIILITTFSRCLKLFWKSSATVPSHQGFRNYNGLSKKKIGLHDQLPDRIFTSH